MLQQVCLSADWPDWFRGRVLHGASLSIGAGGGSSRRLAPKIPEYTPTPPAGWAASVASSREASVFPVRAARSRLNCAQIVAAFRHRQ